MFFFCVRTERSKWKKNIHGEKICFFCLSIRIKKIWQGHYFFLCEELSEKYIFFSWGENFFSVWNLKGEKMYKEKSYFCIKDQVISLFCMRKFFVISVWGTKCNCFCFHKENIFFLSRGKKSQLKKLLFLYDLLSQGPFFLWSETFVCSWGKHLFSCVEPTGKKMLNFYLFFFILGVYFCDTNFKHKMMHMNIVIKMYIYIYKKKKSSLTSRGFHKNHIQFYT